MKKLYSLVRACMTSDMSLFKIKTKKNSKSAILPLVITLYLMFVIWANANLLLEKFSQLNLTYFLLAMFVFAISLMTFMEGIYKSGSLIFNCKDDQLLLSLPIKRRTVLFVRIFKFYVFELLFNSMFLIPVMIAYIRWGSNITWTYYLTSFIMLLLLPIILIVLSCIVGVITSSLSSRFKYKNVAEIIISMLFVLGILYVSFNMNSIFVYVQAHATSMNDLITKIYYPAGMYSKLVTNFNINDLLIFILINVSIFVIAMLILGKFYFKINSRLKNVVTSKNKVKVSTLSFKSNNKTKSLIKKEINSFFKIPVLIINAGFASILFIIGVVLIAVKFDNIVLLFENPEISKIISKDLILNNISLIIFLLISLTAFMTSITSSLISLEGKNIGILKSLPVKEKTILMSKIYAALVMTTPVLLIGDIVLFFKFKTSIIEAILLILLSILMPLASHLVGLIVNLKYPKLEWESATEVVKQSASSLVAVMIGMLLFILSVVVIVNIIGKFNSTLILLIATIIFIVIDIILYLYLVNKSVKNFDKLSI